MSYRRVILYREVMCDLKYPVPGDIVAQIINYKSFISITYPHKMITPISVEVKIMANEYYKREMC